MRMQELKSALNHGVRLMVWVGWLLLTFGCGLSKPTSEPSHFTSCSTNGGAGASRGMAAPSGNAADLAAFTSTLYPAITTAPMQCSNCHGSTQAPLFAVSPAGAAMGTILSNNLVNWDTPDSSLLIAYAGNGHCSASNCQGNSALMQKAVEAWVAAENGAAPTPAPEQCAPDATPTPSAVPTINGYIVTQAQSYPTALPTPDPTATTAPNAFTQMTFPLDTAGVPGAKFYISVQILANASAAGPVQYQFKEPRLAIAPGGAPVQLSEIHVFVNGSEPVGMNDYLKVASTVIESTPVEISPLFSKPVLQQTGTDQIQFGFKILKTASVPSCQNLSGFQTNVYGASGTPGTLMGTCASCHGSSSGSGYGAFPMDGDVATVCARALSRSTPLDSMNSSLIKNPLAGWDGHPQEKAIDATYEAFSAWIQSEGLSPTP